jgi:uncharacterized membrane protein
VPPVRLAFAGPVTQLSGSLSRRLAPIAAITAGSAFAILTTALSWLKWANFGYRTFDLAFYVQGLWLFLRGKFHVSLLDVPLLGNHVDLIVFALAPVFAIIPHPMTLVSLQNLALGGMAPTGYLICRRLGLREWKSALLGVAILIGPAAGYIALHEFHPEAFTAPFLLLMFHARLRGSLVGFWCWLAAVLACKENMPLLIVAYGCVQAIADRKLGLRHLWLWDFAPIAVSLAWLILCAKVIMPALNGGQVEFGSLYSHLGSSAGDIIRHFFTDPSRSFAALSASLSGGNLLPALLLPFGLLPLLRARWLVVAGPILMQHLLSWRQSEWMIYFHYGAPLLPLFWMAAVEAIAWFKPSAHTGFHRFIEPRAALPILVFSGSLATQFVFGPAGHVDTKGLPDVAAARRAIAAVPPHASVVAPLPYLSHLAMREEVQSLHYVLKGLGTLSRLEMQRWEPADFVIIDHSDTATFDRVAGYFHPQMRTVESRIIPSSERLLHLYLRQTTWLGALDGPVAVYRRGIQGSTALRESEGARLDAHTRLVSIEPSWRDGALVVDLAWQFEGEREVIPWMELAVFDETGRPLRRIVKGLCAPDGTEEGGPWLERWRCESLPPGTYRLRADFWDQSKRIWAGSGQLPSVDAGTVRAAPELQPGAAGRAP